MSGYAETFRRLRSLRQRALIPFTVMGDPTFEKSLRVVQSLVRGGADILELGVPFSDPIADGPVIQAADVRALRAGFKTAGLFRFIREVRKFTQVPIGLLLYYNIILQYGVERFIQEGVKAGVNSLLVADLPPQEAGVFFQLSKKNEMGTVFIVSELTDLERLKKILKMTTAFVYIVSRLGVTGVRQDIQQAVFQTLERIRPLTLLPLCVGFGISNPAQVSQVARGGADGVIVGSAIVKKIEALSARREMGLRVQQFVRQLKQPLIFKRA